MSNNFSQEFFNHYEKNSTSDEIQKYYSLWKSVISQAIADTSNKGKKTESSVIKRRAMTWLSGLNQDFVYTCTLANYDPAYVKKKVQPIIARNKKEFP